MFWETVIKIAIFIVATGALGFMLYAAFAVILLIINKIIAPRTKKILEYTERKGHIFKSPVFIAPIIIAGVFLSMKIWWGNEEIGSFFSKYSFDTKRYVLVTPDGDSAKCYRLPANIEVSGSSIYIYSAKWPNGGMLEINDHVAGFQDSISTQDSSGRYYTIMLLNIIPHKNL